MYAVEFETDVTSPFIHLQNFEQFMNQHVRVIVLADREALSTKPSKRTDHLVKLRQRRFNVDSTVDIDAMMSEMNHGLS